MINNKVKMILAGVAGAFIVALMIGIPNQLHAFRAPDEDPTNIQESTILPEKQESRTGRIPGLKSILKRNLNRPLKGDAFLKGDAAEAAKSIVDELLTTGAISWGESLSVDKSGTPQRVLSTTSEARVKRIQTDKLGYKHIRLAQYYQGLPVVGGEIIVHIKNGDLIYQINGKYLPEIKVSVTPSLDADAALAIGLDEHQGKEGLHVAEQPALVIYGGHLAYHYVISYEGEEAGQWWYYVDAHSGELIFRYDNIQYACPGCTSGSNPIISGNRLAGEDGSVVSMQGRLEGTYYMTSCPNVWQVYDLDAFDCEQNSDATWGTADRAAVSGGKNFEDTQDWVMTVLGRDSFDDAHGWAQANVHEGSNYCNAYWDGSDFHFGDGYGPDYPATCLPLTVLDVAAHEYGHAVTQYTSNLVYAYEPGALNESYSDIMGALVEFDTQTDNRASYPNASPGTADWLMGEDGWGPTVNDFLRDMRDPHRGSQPSYYHGTHWYFGSSDNGGVHTNSGVQNHAYYLLAEGCSGSCINDGHPYDPITGIGIADAGEVAMYANMNLLTSNAQYSDARQAWIDAATALGHPTATVEAVWDAVGVGSPSSDCPPVAGGDFEGGVIPPTDWTHVQNNTTETWQIHTLTPYEGTYAAECLYDPNLVNQDEWLVTPYITDPTEVNFWSEGSLYWCRDTYDNCDLEVWLINGPGVNDGDDVYLGKADDDWPADYTYAKSTFSISPPAGTPVRIGFRYVGNDGAQIVFDLVKVCSDSVPDCTLVNDGSFENGPPPGSAWTEWSNHTCGSLILNPSPYFGIPANDGTYAYWAGGYCGGVPISGYVEQSISIPAGAAMLNFRTVFSRGDADDFDGDQFIVSIDGTPVFSRDMVTANNTLPNWVEQSVDISAYAGQTVNLRFEGVSNGAQTGNVLVDFIEICTPPSNGYGDELATDFGANGLWHFDGASWSILTSWNPDDDLAGWSGGMAVDFGGNGLWNHDGSLWSQLTGWNPGSGGLAGWSGGLAVDFDANGLWSHDGASWSILTSWNPQGMAGWNGSLAVDFGGNGLWNHDGSSWSILTGWNPGSGGLTGWSGSLAVDFDANGLWSYDGSSWSQLTTWNPQGMTGWNGSLAVDFGVNGLWSWDGLSWSQLTSWNPTTMSGWGGGLAVDFGVNGLWNNDGSSWSMLTSWPCENMADVDLN